MRHACFYVDWMLTSLRFMFLAYIWMLVRLMIAFLTNLLGSNPVSVLTTLISSLRQKSSAHYPPWTSNIHYNCVVTSANVGYVTGKHILLFLVAVLVFFLFFFPYTLVLLFGQWLQAMSHLRFLWWVNSGRLKPFMDSYHSRIPINQSIYLPWIVCFALRLTFASKPQLKVASYCTGSWNSTTVGLGQ